MTEKLNSDNRIRSISNETEKSKKKSNFFLKGINSRFFHRNKTISKAKNFNELGIFKKSNNKRKNFLFKDIILKCLQNLDLKSLGQAKQTCKEWKSLIETNEQIIWRQLCKNYWGLDHKKYTNNQVHHIYDVKWKEIFLLNYNMYHEKYYFTSHHQPFQMGEAQKKKRFHHTYLNINPYAFPGTSIVHPSNYYPFPYPNPNFKEINIPKENIISSISNGILTPFESSASSSSSINNSPETPKSTIKQNHHINTNEISTPLSLNDNDIENEPSSGPSFSSSPMESPASPSTSSVSSLPPNTPNSNIEDINNIENSSSIHEINDDEVEFYSSSSSSTSSPPPSNPSTISSYFSKVNFLNKFTNGHNKKSNKKYLMVWPYGMSEPYTVSFCGHYLFWIYNFREIQVYDVETRKNVCRLKGHDEEIGLVLSNHQHYIVSFDLNSVIIIWDIRNFSIKRRINVKDSLGLIISMSVHRDRMVATNNKGLIMVWNINTGDLITSYKIPKEFINPNEEENFTNVALWNDYIAFALQNSVYFIYDISKNKCVNIMYHPQNQRAQEMFSLIQSRLNLQGRRMSRGNEGTHETNEEEDDNASNINQILDLINQRQGSLFNEEIHEEILEEIQDYSTRINNHHIPHQPHPILEEETQEMMMPNPNNSFNPPTEEVEEDNNRLLLQENGEEVNNENNINNINEENLEEIIERQSQYPFTLALNSHLLLTNGPERNKLSIWSLKTGQLLYNLSEANALEKLDLHLPTLRMNDLFCELNFAEFSTDYSFIYTTLQYEQESSLAVWDFRSDQYPQKPRYFDIIDLNIDENVDEQPKKFWICYETENDDEE